MRILSGQPLRRQIAAGACLFLAAFTGVVVWSVSRTAAEGRALVRTEAASVAVIAADHLNQYLDGLDTLASALVEHPAVQALDTPECNRLFSHLLQNQPLLANVFLRGTDGSLRGSGDPLINQVGGTTPAYLQQALDTGRPTTSELIVGQITQRPFVARAFPVRGRDGSIVGVLGFGLNLSRLQSVFQRVGLPPGSVVSVVDAEGRILSRSLDPDAYIAKADTRMVGPAGSLPVVRADVDDIERYHGDVPIERGPWLLSVGIPSSEVFNRLAPLWGRNLAVAVTTVGLLLAVSLFIAYQTSRGLEEFTLAARRVADGDLSPPAAGWAPNLETAQLQTAFTTMVANLRETHAALDLRVDEERKTRELLQSLQRQMVRQERLAAVDLLSSGVAHELNNPLQAIMGTVQILERDAHLGPDAREELAFIKTQSGRAREIIRSLSRFSTQQPGPPSVIDPRDVVAEAVRLRRGGLAVASIDLELDLSSSRKVLAHFPEIEQVAINFMINAQQAIESTGRTGGRMLIRLYDTAGGVRFEVHDDGPGVSGEDESKLFQPFFTTRPVGMGTGLGLSVSYGIIDSYGGSIGHQRNPWGGATFFFELPSAEAARILEPPDAPERLVGPERRG